VPSPDFLSGSLIFEQGFHVCPQGIAIFVLSDGLFLLETGPREQGRSAILFASDDFPVGKAAKCTVTGLTSGTQYWFQVRAIGAAGPSAWSDPATKRAT